MFALPDIRRRLSAQSLPRPLHSVIRTRAAAVIECRMQDDVGRQMVANHKPVGVFDSGVGGLSVLQALRQELPYEHFLYAGDSGCAPYGDRSAAFVVERAITITEFLVSQGREGCRGRVQHGDGCRGRVASRTLRHSDRRDRAGGEARGIAHALARRRRAGDDRHVVEPEYREAARELWLRCGVRHPAVSGACRSGRERGARVGRDARAGAGATCGPSSTREATSSCSDARTTRSCGRSFRKWPGRRSTSSIRRRPLRASCGAASNRAGLLND